jgi:phosphoesterase PA-phosphatase related
VGMSRIYLVRHWTTDVVASVILSYFIAKIIYKKINMQWYKINHLKNIIFNIKYKKRKLEVIN